MIYPDLQFASSILIKGDYSEEAAGLLRNVPHPLGLSIIHRLQIENGLLRLLYGDDPVRSEIAQAGLRIWRQYLDEQVFAIQPFDLELAAAKAASWNAISETRPPKWGLLLHTALAVTHGATFLSFDPALRKQAAIEGTSLLPERL